MAGKSKKDMNPWFAEQMQRRGWETLTEMSERTGIKRATVQNLAFETVVPTWRTAQLLAEAFGVEVPLVFEGLASGHAELAS